MNIWRWAETDDLEDLFTGLIGASEADFAQAAAGEPAGESPSETEARLRAMDLPPEILEQTLKGFREMVAEAQDADPEPPVVALASSHPFGEAPYSALSDEEIAAQVAALTERYAAAIGRATGREGARADDFLGVTDATDWPEDLTALGLDPQSTVWSMPEAVFYLTVWENGRDLPVDIGFGRVSGAFLDGFR